MGDGVGRVEQIGLATLYLGDCREVLPTISGYQAVITDPVWPEVSAGLLRGHEDPRGLLADMVELLADDVRQLVVMLASTSDPRFLGVVPERLPFQQVAWLSYALPSYLGRVLGGEDVAYVFGTPVRYRAGRRLVPSRGPISQPTPRSDHPCPRSLAHQRWLVNWFSDEDETVLDPFMGSGTTGMAAVEQGRRFVGIEVEERYFDLACERIEGAQQQGRLAL